MPTSDQIMKQSKQAYGQWAKQWRRHASAHAKYEQKPLTDFENIGVGKALVLVANGYTFEENLETLKKYRDNVDVMACDKTLGHLIENGIYPDYCMVCDANVNYEKYLEPYKDKLKNTVMFQNVCGNPKWSEAEWKDKYFFVNMDIMNNEKEFSGLSGCNNLIPAATNVSNAMVVFCTQSDNKKGRQNFLGYDKYLMIGFDYSWRPDGKYYSFDYDGDGKRFYMKHVYAFNNEGKYCYTSNNLLFSVKWLEKYLRTFRLPVVQCGKGVMLQGLYSGDFDKQIQYRYKTEDSQSVRDLIKVKNEMSLKIMKINNELKLKAKDHYKSFIASV